MSRDIDSRFKNSPKVNQNIVNEFIDKVINEYGESELSLKQYRSTLIRLLEFSNHEPVNQISFDTINEYLSLYKNPRTMLKEVSYLKKFFQYIKEEHSINFDIIKLLNFKPTILEVEPSARIPLTFEEVITLRFHLEKECKYAQWLTFELIYQLGLRYSDLIFLTRKAYDPVINKFKNQYSQLVVSELITYLISQGALPKKELTPYAFALRIKEIGKLLGRDLHWEDINFTREKSFFRCPKCKELFENIQENWSVFEENGVNLILCKKNCSSSNIERINIKEIVCF